MSTQESRDEERKKAMHPWKPVDARQVATSGGGYSVTVKPEWVGCQLHAVAIEPSETGSAVVIELWLEEKTPSIHQPDTRETPGG